MVIILFMALSKDWMNKTIKVRGIETGLDWFESVDKPAEKSCPLTASGTYRKVALKPENFEFSTRTCTNANMPHLIDVVSMETNRRMHQPTETKVEK